MKNIDAILAEAGVEVTDEQKKTINAAVNENYKTVNDWQKQVDKVTSLTETLETTQKELKKFEGVDAEKLNAEIKKLQETIENNEKDYEAKIADRDFNDTIEKAIAGAKGKNAKAIKALLDVEKLKASKNQQQDIDAAIKALSEAEDSKMLFGEPDPQQIGKGDPIGTVKKENGAPTETLHSVLTAHYTN